MGMKLTGAGTSLPALHKDVFWQKGGGQELPGLRSSLPDLSASERRGQLEVSLPYGLKGPVVGCLRALGNPVPWLGLIFKSHLWVKPASWPLCTT